MTGNRIPWEELSDSDSDSDSDTEDAVADQLGDASHHTELEQMLSGIAEINTCLMRLSMAIRNPAPHDQFKESKDIDISHFEAFDIAHVRAKFPDADEYLIIRLGKGISRRRQYLRYRDQHRKRLEQGIECLDEKDAVVDPIGSTVASSIPAAMKTSAATAHIDESEDHEERTSQTSFASSNTDGLRLRPPPLPEEGANSRPFECPLCFRFTSVRDPPAW